MTVDDSLRMAAIDYFKCEEVEVTRVDEVHPGTTAAGIPFYVRDRLLDTFSRRLVGLLEHAYTEREFLISVAHFVRNLVVLESETRLYYFDCLVRGERWGGWATEDWVLWAHTSKPAFGDTCEKRA